MTTSSGWMIYRRERRRDWRWLWLRHRYTWRSQILSERELLAVTVLSPDLGASEAARMIQRQQQEIRDRLGEEAA